MVLIIYQLSLTLFSFCLFFFPPTQLFFPFRRAGGTSQRVPVAQLHACAVVVEQGFPPTSYDDPTEAPPPAPKSNSQRRGQWPRPTLQCRDDIPAPARHPAGRRLQPAGESPTPAGAAPRLPECGRPLRRVVALRSRCALWRPWRLARGNAHCAKLRVRRGRASAPTNWIPSSPGPAKPGLPFALHRVPDTFASEYPTRARRLFLVPEDRC